jgi:hypothetical protein
VNNKLSDIRGWRHSALAWNFFFLLEKMNRVKEAHNWEIFMVSESFVIVIYVFP